jgi:hypothetical protein
VLEWQSPGYDGGMRCGILSLNNIEQGELIIFTYYATTSLVPLVFSILFTLL